MLEGILTKALFLSGAPHDDQVALGGMGSQALKLISGFLEKTRGHILADFRSVAHLDSCARTERVHVFPSNGREGVGIGF
jgi:hypothetical protein